MKTTFTFEMLSWAAFLARVFGDLGPDAYMSVYRDSVFRNNLVNTPSQVQYEEVCFKLIKGFLNKWRSRFPNNEESANAILMTLQENSALIQETAKFKIESVNFDLNLTVGPNQISVSEIIVRIFNSFANCYGYRTTAGAKLMGVINPDLFVMWDDSIAFHYLNNETKNIYTGQGYVLFLKKMQQLGRHFIEDFDSTIGETDPATYLSTKLNVIPSVPLAKYLDEYNWVTITRKVQIPPKWHPGH